MDGLKIGSKAVSSLEINKSISNKLKVGGKFRFECFDKDGNLKWVSESKNTVTNEGLLYLLDQVFGAAAKVAQWYVGLYTATVGRMLILPERISVS